MAVADPPIENAWTDGKILRTKIHQLAKFLCTLLWVVLTKKATSDTEVWDL